MWFSVDKGQKEPMLRQIYGALRTAMLSGELAAGAKLPSTRELAEELRVSRNVVLEAYELLLAEGFVEGRAGSGTYVVEGAQLQGEGGMSPAQRKSMPEGASAVRREAISGGGASLPDPGRVALEPTFGPQADGSAGGPGEGDGVISFRSGVPALDRFPRRQWGALLQRVCLEEADLELGYGPPAGDPELRRELALYLQRTRGVAAEPERIVVTAGAVQALQLAARLLLGPEDRVLAEGPTNGDLLTILASTGASLSQIPVDDGGMMTELLPDPEALRPKCIYVTPSHQFPMGGILPIQRRIALIGYAARTGGYVLEDDYDSEFRYGGAPVQSLQSLAPERVIYIGTFSKILFPALRIGYAVLPRELTAPFIGLKRLTDYQTPGVEQRALARYIAGGQLARHVRRMKKLYRSRRDALTASLQERLGEAGLRFCGQPAGLHLVAELDRSLPGDWEERLRRERVWAAALEGGWTRLLLGYGHLDEALIREGVARLARALDF
ncbi:PLP-dependent aminotransferase family protein [Gorillibacterium sp. sgz5001074]|uniref:MocR-like pyridoxine biosynthesis transcription factor PdxR n=1 Tax=Gorillibacterium sp. sgz5001074 TaxID=3446695 RepID=UPI003F67C262